MKKIIICNIPMKPDVEKTVYKSDDESLPASDKPYRYPINSFLSQTVSEEDEFKIILLGMKDRNPFYDKNIAYYKEEIEEICAGAGVKAEFICIDTAFSQEKEIHEQLMGMIVDEIDVGAHIMVDITYGPKALPIIVFSVLNFAEKFLNCEVDNIIYGQAEFKNNKVVRSVICDVIPLYCLSSLTNIIKCDDPQKARQILKSLLSI